MLIKTNFKMNHNKTLTEKIKYFCNQLITVDFFFLPCSCNENNDDLEWMNE